MYTSQEYRAELMKAIVIVRNLMLEPDAAAAPHQNTARGIHLEYATNALNEVRKLLPVPERKESPSQIKFREWVEKPDPDTKLFDFSNEAREHIRDGSYSRLDHNCSICLWIDRVVYG